MHMLFFDESGEGKIPDNPHSEDNIFVFGGVIIRASDWPSVRSELKRAKSSYSIPERLELKWKNLIRGTGPVSHLDESERLQFYCDLFHSLATGNLVIGIATVVRKYESWQRNSFINNEEDVYKQGFRYCLQRFLLYLSEHEDGLPAIVIGDKRQDQQDNRLRAHFDELMSSDERWVFATGYRQIPRIIEGLLLQNSVYSVGVQIADLVVGGIAQRYRRGDMRWYNAVDPIMRRSPEGAVAGWGLAMVP